MDHSFHFSNTRVIRSLWKSDSLFLRANRSFFSLNHISWGWKQILCSFKFIALLALLKRRCVWIALVTLLKRLIHSFKKWKRAIHSYFVKKRAIRTKNQRAHSQPCPQLRIMGQVMMFSLFKRRRDEGLGGKLFYPLDGSSMQISLDSDQGILYISSPLSTGKSPHHMWILSTTPSLSKDFLISPSSCEDLQHWTMNWFSMFKILSCRKVKGET